MEGWGALPTCYKSTADMPLVADNSDEGVSNMVFYAQSTITVISGRYTFRRYTITVKNMSMLKTYVYSDFLNSRKKWVKHKLKTFSQIYMLCQVNPENQSLCKRKTEIHV